MAHLGKRHRAPEWALPRLFLEQHGGKDLDALVRTMSNDAFGEAWPLLQQPTIGSASFDR